ncbi:unnamed protein product [Paramecium pentaurelia]|uniref:protein-tyrosine-phosphatase n=1 Tax=Paramecium pentaurelia TaxID=43138 RepID=A0A8S1VB35_9CILI|nr:unnamed protein product [Paramecium pentaurelia]
MINKIGTLNIKIQYNTSLIEYYFQFICLQMFHTYLMPKLGDPMNCIIQGQNGKGGLYLGNIESAGNGKLLGHHDIGAILAVMSTKDYTYDAHIAHKFIRIDDADFVNLSKYFEEAIDFIDINRQQTNVLVHCHAGVSRSATIVIAYLMKTQNMSLEQAFKHVQNQRRIVNPNPGFMRQLKQYESKLQGSNSLRTSTVKQKERQHSQTNLRQSQYIQHPTDNYNSLYQQYQPHRQYQSASDLMRQSQYNYERLNSRQMHYPYMPQHYAPYVRNYSVPYGQNPLNFSTYRQGCY